MTRDEILRMNAYYYSFAPTGNRAIDRILSAVACAGKSFHHTSDWNEDSDWQGNPYDPHPEFGGASPVEWIQRAANDAAAALAAHPAAPPVGTPVADFHAWAERRARDRGPMTPEQFALAMEAFYAARPGEGPRSTVAAPSVGEAERLAFRAGFMAVWHRDDSWTFNGPSAADKEPAAWAAWEAQNRPEASVDAVVAAALASPAPQPAAKPTGVEDEGDGIIGIDFARAKDAVVSVTLYPDGTWGWSALANGNASHGYRQPLPQWARDVVFAVPAHETPGKGWCPTHQHYKACACKAAPSYKE